MGRSKYTKLENIDESDEPHVIQIISTHSIPIIQSNTKDVDASKGKTLKNENDGFPWLQLSMVYLLVIGDSTSLTIAGPFVPEMCQQRFGIAESDIGIAVGSLSGIYSFASVLSSSFLGHLSDVYGRKPVLLLGSFFGAVTTLMFGLSPTLSFAMWMRAIGGFMSANVAVTKAVISDSTATKPQHRVTAFGYHGAAFSAARGIASALSGLTTGVILTRDTEHWLWLANNPYAFPCIIGSLVLAVAFVGALVFIPETNEKRKPICGGNRDENKNTNNPNNNNYDDQTHKKQKNGFISGLKEIWNDKLMFKLIILTCINTFCNGGLLIAMPLLFALSISKLGLGFSSFEIGIAFTVFGIVALIYQVLFFKKTVDMFKQKKAYIIGVVLLGTSTLLYPTTSVFYAFFGGEHPSILWKIITWGYLSIVTVGLSVGFMLALPIASSMMSNVADPRRQGLVMGTTQSVSSILRALGPITSGVVFAASIRIQFPGLLFLILGILYFVCMWIAHRFTDEEVSRLERAPKSITEIELEESGQQQHNNDKRPLRDEERGLMSEDD